MKLDGAVAAVTGGSGGLGGRICRELASAGARVAVLYNQSREKAEGLVDELRTGGSLAEAIHCDVTDRSKVDEMVAQVLQRFGRLDILVNDAGYNKWIPYDDIDALTYEDWSKLIDVNLTGPMLTIKAASRPMKAQGGGHIINIASVAGVGPTGSSIAYAVAKSGLIHLTKCMAVGLAPDILVNCIAPGYLEGTKMSDNLAPEYKKASVKNSLLQRAADKDDIARQVVAFSTTDSVTGQTLIIDSGRVFH